MLAVFLFSNSIAPFALASVPSGTDWFEIHANPFTGLDDTGDGGTGDPLDLNYFYVGQSFEGNMSIQSGGTTAANIWTDYDSSLLSINSLLVGDYFDSWENQLIENTRFKSTGYNISTLDSSGLGNFGSFDVQLIASNVLGADTILKVDYITTSTTILPDVDFAADKIVVCTGEENLIGHLAIAKITASSGWTLRGEITNQKD